MEFKNFINQKFIEFERAAGERKTVTNFAEYLDENQGNVSHWLNGTRVPQKKVLDRLAKILGPEVYAAAGYIEPMPENPLLRHLLRLVDGLPKMDQEYIVQLAEQKAAEKKEGGTEKPLTFQLA